MQLKTLKASDKLGAELKNLRSYGDDYTNREFFNGTTTPRPI